MERREEGLEMFPGDYGEGGLSVRLRHDDFYALPPDLFNGICGDVALPALDLNEKGLRVHEVSAPAARAPAPPPRPPLRLRVLPAHEPEIAGHRALHPMPLGSRRPREHG